MDTETAYDAYAGLDHFKYIIVLILRFIVEIQRITQNARKRNGSGTMRNQNIEPLHFRDFMVMLALVATVALVLWGTVSTIAKNRPHFEAPPVIAR